MKIVVLDGYTLNPGDLDWNGLEALGELTVYDRTPHQEMISRIGDAEIVYTNKTPLDEKIFASCPNLRFIGVLATGFNIVDIEAAKKHGIVVANVPTYGTTAVAQYVFALLLEVCHHVGAHSQAVAKGDWSSQEDFCFWNYPLIELAGKTFGIIGLGRIGQATAKIAKSFGMDILAYDQNPSPVLAQEWQYTDLDTLLAQSDVISLHCPLTPQTQGLIHSGSILKMKPSAILINTSRGPLVIEQDVAEALNQGRIFAYAADVASVEPIPGDSPLLQAKNCILTPHIAWASKESRKRLMDIAVANLTAFLSGDPINIVNP